MKKVLTILGRVAKVLVVAAAASVVRIARGQGEGVFETAIQQAFAEMATRYARSVNP